MVATKTLRISPWFAGFTALWVLGEILAWRQGGLAGPAGSGLSAGPFTLIFCGITWWLTKGHDTGTVPAKGILYPVQIAAVGLCYAGILLFGVTFNLGGRAPWNPFSYLHHAVSSSVTDVLHGGIFALGIANVVVYVVPPAKRHRCCAVAHCSHPVF